MAYEIADVYELVHVGEYAAGKWKKWCVIRNTLSGQIIEWYAFDELPEYWRRHFKHTISGDGPCRNRQAHSTAL